MNDLISRKALLESLKEQHDYIMQDPEVSKNMKWCEAVCFHRTVETAEAAPAVDAEMVFEAAGLVKEAFEMAKSSLVPVVRCKDCNWFNSVGCAIYIVDESDKPKENDFAATENGGLTMKICVHNDGLGRCAVSGEHCTDGPCDCENLVEFEPVRHGRWEGTADGYWNGEPVYDIWNCSECGFDADGADEKPDWKYCPHCGAKMDGISDLSEIKALADLPNDSDLEHMTRFAMQQALQRK